MRTIQGRFLLRPGRAVNRLIAGVLGRAQRLCKVEIVGLVVLSNHLHLLVYVETGRQMSDFMRYVNGNVAREVSRVHNWSGPFWDRRYTSITVWTDERDQVGRLRYLLEQGCKENLVGSPREWPGLSATRALLAGRPIQGVWIDRTRWHRASQSDRKDSSLFREKEVIVFSPLPCWKHLAPAVYRCRIAEMIRDIECTTAQRHRRERTEPLGVARVCSVHPHQRAAPLERSPMPRFHCASRVARKRLSDAYSEFYKAFRAAAAKLKLGDSTAVFPEGVFPPAAPFVEPIRGPA